MVSNALKEVALSHNSIDNLSTKGSFHVSFLYGGHKGKGNKTVNIVTSGYGGRGHKFDKQHGVDEFKTCHAERNCLCNIKPNHFNKLHKATMYVVGFRRITDRMSADYGKLDSFIGKPCISCCKMMKQVGINKVKYSMASGDIISDSVDNLLTTAIVSSGMRHNITADFSLWIRNKHSFNFIKKKKKIIEGRIWDGIITGLKIGLIIRIRHGNQSIRVQIIHIYRYVSFNLMLKNHLKECLPAVSTISNGVKYYRKFYSIKDEKKFDIVAIKFNII